MSRKPSAKSRPEPDPILPEDLPEESNPEDANGAATATEESSPAEEPAQVQLTIKGSDRSARAAAKRFGGEQPKPPPIATPSNEPAEPDDPTAALLSDGKNMVIVTRQKPRVIRGPDDSDFATNVRIPGRYSCPTSKSEIEELVFSQHGGSKYKCTIHPDTTDGENKILGHFTIEHPDPKCPPFIDGVTINLPEPEPEPSDIPTGRGDPTMRETDPLVKMKEALQRRLERAQMKKEIEEIEAQVREMEGGGKTTTPAAPPVESDELRKLREEVATLRRDAETKKVDDRFVALQSQLAETNKAILALAEKIGKPAANQENSLVQQLITQSNQHAKDMVDLIGRVNRPTAEKADNLDAMLDKLAKLKSVFGKDDSRVSEFQGRILDAAIDRFLDGTGGEPDGPAAGDDVDGWKFALKQLTPTIKAYVEGQIHKEGDDAPGGSVPPERVRQIYEEAAAKAAADLKAQWESEGVVFREPGGRGALPAPGRKQQLPPRHPPPGKVVAREKTREGVVEHVRVQPADLSRKSAPRPAAATVPPPASAPKQEEPVVPKKTDMPGVGTVEVPDQPGDIKYDRRRSVNYVLDSIASEIHEGVPAAFAKDPATESCAPGDALDYLDDELLDEFSRVTSGVELEALLLKWGDPEKVERVRAAAGKDPAVESWMRSVVRTIQDVYRDQRGR